MSGNRAVDVECYGTIQRIPLPNPFITIEKLKSIVSSRLKINYPFKLTHSCAELCDEDSLHDLGINSNDVIRVRRCSIDDSYNSDSCTLDSITDVFLSYEHSDQNIVRELKRKLEEKNYFCWLDIDQIPGSNDHFSSAIEQGIYKSTVFVCCITNRYARSRRCQEELSYAKQRDKRIIILLMEDLLWPPPQIQSLVSGLSYIDFYHTTASASSTPWPSEKFDELLTRLADMAPQM